jgi:hypothetical protein
LEVQGETLWVIKMDLFKRKNLSTTDKIDLFRSFFTGLTQVYGTYDPANGRSWQEKKPVTDRTILSHLKGEQPYGVYLLESDRTCAIAVDFDTPDPFPSVEFVNAARHYQLSTYIERSKSKGFHIWIFFNKGGVKAFKARLVVKNILNEIEYPDTEIFPKQDLLHNGASYGNFINTPLFGGLVPSGKTVFVDPHTLKPYPDQWAILESINRVSEQVLDDIIEINDLVTPPTQSKPSPYNSHADNINRFCLPPCAQKMLRDGVTHFQRVSCFRLAVHLKRQGLPFDVAVAALKVWGLKNKPLGGKQIITEHEIVEQTSCAYSKNYRGFGCQSEAVAPFCHSECPIHGY